MNPDDLLRAERRVALLSAFARGIVCEFDSECRYRDVWATDERLLAMPASDLIGRTIVEAVGDEVGWSLMHGTARVYATGTSETFEYTLQLPTGPRAFEAEVVRVPTESGPEPYRVVALIRDVTEEKELERRLNEAERLAALGVLAAGIGHEINNPLMIVQENVRMVAQQLREASTPTRSTDAMLDMLADVLAAVSRMQKNVADLRLFRHDDGVRLDPIDPRAAVTRAIKLTVGQIQQRAVLEQDLGPTPLVVADETKLGQVVLNLLVNATQALPEGSAHAQRISVTTRTDERGWAIVEVTDNGPGIPRHELPRIFDPFFTTKREGMGLGLSVCQRIVTGYGGTIDVDSDVGQGTRFRVTLPPSTADSMIATSAAATMSPRVRRQRLLVIDDEPALLRVLALTVGEEHEVVTAGGCEAALEILSSDMRFDSILCDLMMPLGDGMSFYRRLETIAPELQPKVIFMSGGAFTPAAARFLESIPNRMIGKPFEIDALHRILNGLSSRRATDEE